MTKKRIRVVTLVFVFSFTICVLAGEMAVRNLHIVNSFNHLTPAVRTVVPPKDDEYPAFFGTSNNHHTLDHYVLYHNLDGWIDHAREADIIFSGNSRVLYGWHLNHLKELSKGHGLSFYNLGFQCAEGMGFSYEIIKKFGLTPKMVIVNGDEFFPRYPSEFAKNVIKLSGFGAWKSVFEDKMYFRYMLFVHKYLPYWENIIHPGAILIYRSTTTGWWTFGFPNPPSEQQVVYGQDREHPVPLRDFALANAKKYKQLLDERNISLVITWIPKPAFGNVTEVKLIAKELDIPYIPVTDLNDLYTFDWSHLDAKSSKIFSERFYRNLVKHKVFQDMVAKK